MATARNTSRFGLKRLAWGLIVALGCLLAGIPLFQKFPLLLVYNASPSIPKGFYRVRNVQSISIGDLVVARLPKHIQALAKERGYLPEGVPPIKPVAAGPGDWICHEGGWLYINRNVPTHVPKADSKGRGMPQWKACRRMAEGEYFLLLPHVEMSFDSRYFGPVRHADIVGKATPFLVFEESIGPSTKGLFE
ncbi:MAG: S26 family signal peptidase [Sphingomonadales bacterium]|nr:S26 family signal peptidase [Sphingomonadales bacterium]